MVSAEITLLLRLPRHHCANTKTKFNCRPKFIPTTSKHVITTHYSLHEVTQKTFKTRTYLQYLQSYSVTNGLVLIILLSDISHVI